MSSRDTSNRRDFLQGRAAVNAIAGAIDRMLPGEEPAGSAPGDANLAAGIPEAPERYLVQYSRPAMACEFSVFLNAGQYDDGANAALAALDAVEYWEERLSVYRETSDISVVNRTATDNEVRLEPRLYTLLALAAKLSAETGGAFDITAGPLVKAWGFYKRAGTIPSDEELSAALARVGSQRLILDKATRTIRFAVPGMELNLGAIGKGYALDHAGGMLALCGVGDFLLHGGQSSVLAHGNQAGASTRGWSVGLRDPLRPERRLAEVYLHNRALATSGATHQFFRHEGKRYGHILDPRTGRPAEGVFSSTVIAPTAAEADAQSTAFYALGPVAAAEYCQRRPEVGMVLLCPGKGGSSVDVVTAGLGAEDWKLLRDFD